MTSVFPPTDKTPTARFSLSLLPLAHLRSASPTSERYFITWHQNGVRILDLDGLTAVEGLELGSALGEWRVDVELWTKEVRKDEEGVLKASKEWIVGKGDSLRTC